MRRRWSIADIFSRDFHEMESRRDKKWSCGATQLAQGCAAVRFALGHGKSIERTLFITIPITRRDHRSERKLCARLGEERQRRYTILVSALQEKTRKSTFRCFANSNRNTLNNRKMLYSFWSRESRERIPPFRTKEKEIRRGDMAKTNSIYRHRSNNL